MIRPEVPQFGWVGHQEGFDGRVEVLGQSHIFEPLVEQNRHFQVDQTGLHGSRQGVYDGPVSGLVTGSHNVYLGMQVMLTYHPVQDQLVSSRLHCFGGRRELVEEQQPAIATGRQLLISEREDFTERVHDSITINEPRQTGKVGWLRSGQTMVDQLQVASLGQLGNDGRFAHTGAGRDEGNQASLDQGCEDLWHSPCSDCVGVLHLYILCCGRGLMRI